MTCCEIIKTVLDEAWEAMAADVEEKVAGIEKQMAIISEKYKNAWSEPPNIDFGDPAVRFAYIYRYVTSHANIVAEIVAAEELLRACFEKDGLTVSCVGGGPGSDFLGIMKYMATHAKQCTVQCFLLDKTEAWDECWCDVDRKASAGFSTSTNFLSVDATDEATWSFRKKYLQADLFTMVYFLSEIYADENRPEIDKFLKHTLEGASEGAKVLFIDNNASDFYGWFDEIAKVCGVDILKKGEYKAQVPRDEELDDLGVHHARFGFPKMKTQVAYRIGVKR